MGEATTRRTRPEVILCPTAGSRRVRLPLVGLTWLDERPLDRCGRRRSPVTLPGYRKGKLKSGNAPSCGVLESLFLGEKRQSRRLRDAPSCRTGLTFDTRLWHELGREDDGDES